MKNGIQSEMKATTNFTFMLMYWASLTYGQGRRLRVASGATAPGPALEGAPRFRPMSLSSYILR